MQAIEPTQIVKKKEEDVYVKMERLDEQQIQEEIQGLTLMPSYFYEFPSAQGQVVGLSWQGTKALRNLMSELGRPITISEVQFEDNGDSYAYTAWAKLMTTGERSPGVSSQQKKITKKDGTEIPDPFARQKALSKAKRNAIKDFIPEDFIKNVYSLWVNSKRQGFPTKEQTAKFVGRSAAKDPPPPADEGNSKLS